MINEHFESLFNDAEASAIGFTMSLKARLAIPLVRFLFVFLNQPAF